LRSDRTGGSQRRFRKSPRREVFSSRGGLFCCAAGESLTRGEPHTSTPGAFSMNDHYKRCDICHQAVVCWPGIFTVLGPMDLCGNCYWRYRRLVESMAQYFNEYRHLPVHPLDSKSSCQLDHHSN
jgi:hypothetical protein